ncbi:sigma-70 family RNA polymerase sigma factor [Paenibacillus sp. P26]|nr:sigma-70 family RNA polymerase sigma factor [Paenibacillus sp. P26]UUZ94767.1 sigma-70 family RNA polymerase sigma factor [Paenibacillus sp. P25]
MEEPHYLKYLAGGYDKDAVLRELMTDYGEDVWNFAYFLTRRREAADDLSQEVFLSVYNRLHTFRGDCTVKSWSLTVTRNKSLNYLRNAFIRKVTLVEYVVRKEGVRSAEAELFDRMETRRIWSLVMKLPRKYREVLLMDAHYQLGMREMAAMLEVTEGTVKSRLHRARRKLSAMLESDRCEGGHGL